MSFRQWNLLALFVAAGGLTAMSVLAQTAYFAVDGKLVTHDGAQAREAKVRRGDGTPATIHRVWGAYQGKCLVTLSRQETKESPSGHTSAVPALPLALVSSDGTLQAILAERVARAFPSPDGQAVAIIPPERRCVIQRGDVQTTLPLEGRASHVAWAPDSTRLAVVLYPEDWSEEKANNAPTTDDFLRLQQSRIVLVDAISLAPLGEVVNDGGTNYNPFFSPDASELYYIHLDLLDDRGGVRKLALADLSTTVGTLIAPAGEPPRGVPLGRVGTYQWLGDRLLFEAGTPDGGGVLWSMCPDGTDARPLGPGRYPQILGSDRIAYLKPDGTVATITPAELQKEAER